MQHVATICDCLMILVPNQSRAIFEHLSKQVPPRPCSRLLLHFGAMRVDMSMALLIEIDIDQPVLAVSEEYDIAAASAAHGVVHLFMLPYFERICPLPTPVTHVRSRSLA